ncbi:MAG: cob(I)yrinic acid a,c-diamide adenosyltransferase [Alphaproteobacteria bacterium GM202ARS2]|nr:cob(I)yrinic acid a,c-diamide adenosyltransferase [Alphaproteobacteria bacterium GM202ARS2]
MVKLDTIYTRGGDSGDTSFGDGSRHSKTHPRIRACGDADEANCFIGIARLHGKGAPCDAVLAELQNDLFDIGADLCQPLDSQTKYAPKRITADYTSRLEAHIDKANADLQPLRSFILPGGSALASWLHVARAVARRCERNVIDLHRSTAINPHVITYLNRLSDLLFVLARQANDNGATDVLWQPAKNQRSSESEH